MVVTALDDKLTIVVFSEKLQAEIKDIAIFLCLAFRMPNDGSGPMISTGSFVGNIFTMTTETPLKASPRMLGPIIQQRTCRRETL